MENFPSPEQENVEQRLIGILKEKGIDNLEAREALDSWTKAQERQVEMSENPAAPIEFNLRRARLYFAAGFIEEAFENFEAARTQALNEKMDDKYEEIMNEMDKLEEGLEK